MKSTISLLALVLLPLSAYAADSWDCNGGELEGLSINTSHGKLEGGVSWDCWPGGGVCNQNTAVTKSEEDGQTVYEGKSFKLTIDTAKGAGPKGFYSANISAKDETDAGDEGRGLTIDQDVYCQSK